MSPVLRKLQRMHGFKPRHKTSRLIGRKDSRNPRRDAPLYLSSSNIFFQHKRWKENHILRKTINHGSTSHLWGFGSRTWQVRCQNSSLMRIRYISAALFPYIRHSCINNKYPVRPSVSSASFELRSDQDISMFRPVIFWLKRTLSWVMSFGLEISLWILGRVSFEVKMKSLSHTDWQEFLRTLSRGAIGHFEWQSDNFANFQKLRPGFVTILSLILTWLMKSWVLGTIITTPLVGDSRPVWFETEGCQLSLW